MARKTKIAFLKKKKNLQCGHNMVIFITSRRGHLSYI